ncbi:MAG: glycosyltransferase family 9 protein, partial [Bacteroidota bacterium]|nr:glycosyltransferase family 9 protein [Bacteroidota bacterium]
HMGDVLMTTPAIKAIKQQYPDSKIYLLINKPCSEIVALNPFVDGIYYYSWPWRSRKTKTALLLSPFLEYCKIYGQLRKLNADIFIEFRGDIRMIFLFGFLTGIPKRVATLRTGGFSFLTTSVIYNKDQHESERIVTILQSMNIPVAERKAEIYFSAEDSISARQIVTKYLSNTDSGYAIIAPFSGKSVKEWIPEHWAVVANYLFEKYHLKSFIAGIKKDKKTAEYIAGLANGCLIDITGDTTITQLAALLSNSKIVIGVDSGSLHLASCFNIPIIALFGPTNQNEFRPYSPFAKIIDLNICKCDKDKHNVCKVSKNGIAFCLGQINCKQLFNSIDDSVHFQYNSVC